MKKRYKVEYKIYRTIEFDDDEMREYGYEDKITDNNREEYLNILLEDEYNIGVTYDDMYYTEEVID